MFRPLSACVILFVPISTAAADLDADYARARSEYGGRLEELSRWCVEQGLAAEAERTRDWPLPDDPHRFFPVMLDAVGISTIAESSDNDAAERWRDRIEQLRREQAKVWFELAARAAAENDAWLAYRLIWQTARDDLDHPGARAALGYRQVDGEWLTRFEADKRRAKQVWHDGFGWLRTDHVARYEAGERFYAGGWMSEDQENRVRADMDRAWSIATEHFVVRTNDSLESGVRLAARLERLYDAWRQMFVGYYATPRDVRNMIAGRPLRPHSPRRYQVVYYRTREEYVDELRSEQPNIDITTGIYLGNQRTAYFFAAEDEDHGTQFHEVTHQLFSESRPVVRDIGRAANFWIVEGVACYMESLRLDGGRVSVGGLEAERMVAARYRLLEDQFYVPLAEFNALGMEALQRDPRIRTLYSQATGWTHFLIHYQDGRYRRALTDYLLAVYTGRDHAGTLAERTGAGLDQLDQQYREFMTDLEEQ